MVSGSPGISAPRRGLGALPARWVPAACGDEAHAIALIVEAWEALPAAALAVLLRGRQGLRIDHRDVAAGQRASEDDRRSWRTVGGRSTDHTGIETYPAGRR